MINNMGLTGATAQEKFDAICQAVDNGTIKAEEFGMSSGEFKKVAAEMLGVSYSAGDMTGKLNSVPKNVTANVNVNGLDDANTKAKNLLSSLGSFAGKVFTATVNVVKKGADTSILGGMFGFETGGTVNESGVYNTQEAGLELIDPVSPSQSAFSLAKATRGELTYIPANSKVTNAAMTTLKMENMMKIL